MKRIVSMGSPAAIRSPPISGPPTLVAA